MYFFCTVLLLFGVKEVNTADLFVTYSEKNQTLNLVPVDKTNSILFHIQLGTLMCLY